MVNTLTPHVAQLIAKLLDDHMRMYPHHAHLCDLCKEAKAVLEAK